MMVARTLEPAPARRRIGVLAVLGALMFLAMGAQAAKLAIEAPPRKETIARSQAGPIQRANLLDRNGELLAATVPGYILIAKPQDVVDPAATAKLLVRIAPDWSLEVIERRLRDKTKGEVHLGRGLTERQKADVFALGLAGIRFERGTKRFYPHESLAAHVLGGVKDDMTGAGGLELGLDPAIARATQAGRAFRVSLDLRVQHVLEQELFKAADAHQAATGAGVILDGRTGEVLAIASWPTFDLNKPPSSQSPLRINNAAGSVYEMGSVIKPFIIGAALEQGLATPNTRPDLSPLKIDGVELKDAHAPAADATPDLGAALAVSSNVMVARMGLGMGAQKQRALFQALGLLQASPVELPESGAPLAPQPNNSLGVAGLSYGYGLSVSVLSMAGAYTVFANEGARVQPSFVFKTESDKPSLTPVFTAETTKELQAMMRRVVVEGTGQRADVPGLDLFGKTGTAERKAAEGQAYKEGRHLSSFAAVFPGTDPRYVLVVALEDPKATVESGGRTTGGAIAAPIAGRIAARIAPVLGVTPTREARAPVGGAGSDGEKLR
jgi:cell division protein FtsI (penicillin-binding protein 3)